MSSTIDLAEMRTFVAVVTDGSFTAAAQRIGTDKARISRTVSRMEEKLGAQLLKRSTRRLSVTEVGRDYFERASGILAAADAATAAVAQRTQLPRGRLKITAGPEFGTTRVDGWIVEFLKNAPDVVVEAEYTNRIVDIIHEGVDVAIRVGELADSDLSARRLGEVDYGLYASPEYLRRAHRLDEITDLARHDLIMHAPRGRPRWILVSGGRTERIEQIPRCTLNNTVAASNMALAGLGIAQLPRYMAEPWLEGGALQRVLGGWARAPAPVHAVFASSRYMDPKVRGFVDLAVASFVGPGDR